MNGDELKVLSLAVRALDRADCTIEIDDFFPSGCVGLANEISSIITKYSKPKPELPILTYAEWKEKYGNDLIATYRYDTIPVHFKHIERMLAVEYARYLCKELVVHAELNGGKLNVSAFKDSPKNAVENFYRLLALSGKKQILENLFS